MSSSAGSANSARYVDFDEYVELKLQKTQSSIKLTDLLVALAGVAAMFLGYLLVFVALDQWVVPGGFGIGLRWTLLLLLLTATVAWLVWKVGRPYLRSVNGLFAAREIEKSEPGLKSNLLNLVDLRASGREVDPAVMLALERHAAVQLQQIDVTQAIDHRPLMRTTYVLLAVLVMFCLYALFSPKKISNSIWRALLPPADVDVATRTLIVSVLPGDVTVLARQSVEITVDLAGVIPERAEVQFSTVDGKFQNERVELRALEGQARFTGSLRGENGQGLMQDLTYVVRANDAVSQTYRITVDQPPSATPEKVKYEFPAYMKLETTEQLGGQIEAWEGTKVTLSARTNLPVKSAVVEFLDNPTDLKSNGEEVPMTVASDGLRLEAKWPLTLRSDATYSKHYRIQCRTEAGVTDPQPTVYGITIQPDLPPEIALLEPVRDLEAPANTVIPLLIQARDPDFELSRINLHVEQAGKSILNETLSDTKQSRSLLKYDLNLAPLERSEGDVIEFWVEAFDNKQPRANRKNTPRLKVTIVKPVSPKEAQQQLAEDQKQRDQRLADAQQEEQNADGTPEQQQTGGDSENQPNDLDKPEREPMPRENGETGQDQSAGKDGDTGKPGQTKGKGSDQGKTANSGDSTESGKGDPKTGDKNNDKPQPNGTEKNGTEKNDTNKNGTGPAKPKPLSSDGEDDDKALEQLIQKLGPPREDKPGKDSPPSEAPKDGARDKPQPPGTNGEKDPKQAKPNPDTTGAEPKSNGTKNDPATQDNPQPGPMPTKTDPDKTGLDKPQETKPKDGVKPNADSKPGNDPKNDKTNKGPQPETTDKPQSNGTKGPKPEPGPKGAESPKNDANTPAENGAEKGDMPKNEATSDKKNKDVTKPGAGDQSDANSPKKESPDKQPPGDKKPGEPNPDSPREPAADSPDAIKKPGTGDEKGPAKPENDPDSQAAPKKNGDPKRDPKDKTNSRSADPKNEEKTTPSKDDPSTSPKPKQEPGKPSNEPKAEQQSTEPGKSPMPRTGQKPPQQGDPKAADEPLKSDQNKDQKSDKPTASGEPGRAKPDKTGTPESKQPGEGDPDKQPGKQQQADSKTGKPDDSKQQGPGSKTQQKDSSKGKSGKGNDPSGKDSKDASQTEDSDKPSDKEGDSPQDDSTASEKQGDKNQAGDQKQRGKKPSGKKSDDPKQDNSQPDSKPQPGQGDEKQGAGKQGQEQSPSEQGDSNMPPADGKPSKKAGGGPAGKPGKPGSGASGQDSPPPDGGPDAVSGDTTTVEQSEAANLEYNRQASELVLKRLQDELERGDVDPQLLEQLGWTEAEMQRFAERLGKHLQEAKSAEETPESLARRQQFEEMLKSLDLKKQGVKRTGEQGTTRDVNLNESRKANVPPQYRKAYEQFTKDLARQKAPATKGPAK